MADDRKCSIGCVIGALCCVLCALFFIVVPALALAYSAHSIAMGVKHYEAWNQTVQEDPRKCGGCCDCAEDRSSYGHCCVDKNADKEDSDPRWCLQPAGECTPELDGHFWYHLVMCATATLLGLILIFILLFVVLAVCTKKPRKWLAEKWAKRKFGRAKKEAGEALKEAAEQELEELRK